MAGRAGRARRERGIAPRRPAGEVIRRLPDQGVGRWVVTGPVPRIVIVARHTSLSATVGAKFWTKPMKDLLTTSVGGVITPSTAAGSGTPSVADGGAVTRKFAAPPVSRRSSSASWAVAS